MNQHHLFDHLSSERFGFKSVAIASTLLITTVLSPLPRAIANSNFGRVNIAASAPQSIQGYTGGSVPLSAIATEDSDQHPCVGYAESDPDHILDFANPVRRITIEVNSRGHDTTLVVQAPDGAVYCGDDEVNGSDALIQGRDWSAGAYKVWVGAFEPGARYDYTLLIRP